MNTIEKINWMKDQGARVVLWGWPASYTNAWDVEVKQQGAGIELTIVVKNADLETAINEAYNKYCSTTSKGIPEFTGLVLAPPQSSRGFSDEIPF